MPSFDEVQNSAVRAFRHYAEEYGQPVRIDHCKFDDGEWGMMVITDSDKLPKVTEEFEGIRVAFHRGPAVAKTL